MLSRKFPWIIFDRTVDCEVKSLLITVMSRVLVFIVKSPILLWSMRAKCVTAIVSAILFEGFNNRSVDSSLVDFNFCDKGIIFRSGSGSRRNF